MSEPLDAGHIEHLLEHGLRPPDAALDHLADWPRQQRVDLLLRQHLDGRGADHAFASIMATLSPQRRNDLAERIDRRIRPPAWRRHLRSGAWSAAAALLMAVGLAWLALRQPAVMPASLMPPYAELIGPVDELRLERDHHPFTAIAGMALLPGDAITTQAMGTVIAFVDGTTLGLDDGARLVLVADNGKRLRLEAGCLTATVARQPADRPLRIDTPHAQAVVVGTVFRLAVDQVATHLGVSEGRVRLGPAAGAMVEVDAGRQAYAGRDHAPVLLPTAEGDGPLRLLDECDDAAIWTQDPRRAFITIAVTGERPYSGDHCLRLAYRFPRPGPSSFRTRSFRFLPLVIETGDTAIRCALRCEQAQPRTDRILCVRTADGSIWRLHEEYFIPDHQWRVVSLPIPGRDQPPFRLEGNGTWDPARITALALGCNEGDVTFCVDAVMAVERP